ncbi:hypothetical protein L596_026446 [Steinernema carpocapsae]|uniref:Uncharacterized protein n=1 Tax=Steinernema carpocapsae TaxID=34508 RepID=A0A4U5M1D9_STECR|nr:hypothetical protein L596_026446 [Steinernema carpocapsae]
MTIRRETIQRKSHFHAAQAQFIALLRPLRTYYSRCQAASVPKPNLFVCGSTKPKHIVIWQPQPTITAGARTTFNHQLAKRPRLYVSRRTVPRRTVPAANRLFGQLSLRPIVRWRIVVLRFDILCKAGAVAVVKPTGRRRQRNACKRKWRRYRNPLIVSIRQIASKNCDTRTDTFVSFSFISERIMKPT